MTLTFYTGEKNMLTTNHITMNKLTSLIKMLILPAALLSACDKGGFNTDCPAGYTGPSCATPVGGGAGAGNGATQETGTADSSTQEAGVEDAGTAVNERPYDLP